MDEDNSKLRPSTSRPVARPSSIDDVLAVLDQALEEPEVSLGEIVADDVETLKANVSAKVDEAKTQAQDFSNEISAVAQAAVGVAIEQGREVATRTARDIDKKVRENIWAVVGGVAIGSLALGFMLAVSSAKAKREQL